MDFICWREQDRLSDVRYLGVDVGKRRVGLALSSQVMNEAGDPSFLALPLETIELPKKLADKPEQRSRFLVDRLVEKIDEYEVGAVVVGLPTRTDGTEGPEAKDMRAFVTALESRVDLPVHLYDERFTTRIAHDAARNAAVKARHRKNVIDQMAAAVILQGFLDRTSN